MPVFRFRFTGTSRQAKRAVDYVLRSLVGFRTGDADQKKSAEIRRRVLTKVANRLLTLIHNEFIIKSLGGQGLDGSRWKPLSPATIDLKMRNVKATNKVRKGIGLRSLRIPKSASSIMSRFAFEEILIETGILQESLRSPGERTARRPRYQIFEHGINYFQVGTCAPKKQWHHIEDSSIRPQKLPYRPFWPRQLHQAWWADLVAELQYAIMDEIRREANKRKRARENRLLRKALNS